MPSPRYAGDDGRYTQCPPTKCIQFFLFNPKQHQSVQDPSSENALNLGSFSGKRPLPTLFSFGHLRRGGYKRETPALERRTAGVIDATARSVANRLFLKTFSERLACPAGSEEAIGTHGQGDPGDAHQVDRRGEELGALRRGEFGLCAGDGDGHHADFLQGFCRERGTWARCPRPTGALPTRRLP